MERVPLRRPTACRVSPRRDRRPLDTVDSGAAAAETTILEEFKERESERRRECVCGGEREGEREKYSPTP